MSALHEDDPQHVRQVESVGSVFSQQHGHDGQVPGVLGIVLPSQIASKQVPAQHLLGLVDLQDERKLAAETAACHGPLVSRIMDGPTPRRGTVLRWSPLTVAVLLRDQQHYLRRRALFHDAMGVGRAAGRPSRSKKRSRHFDTIWRGVSSRAAISPLPRPAAARSTILARINSRYGDVQRRLALSK